jgi:hypothetical protein
MLNVIPCKLPHDTGLQLVLRHIFVLTPYWRTNCAAVWNYQHDVLQRLPSHPNGRIDEPLAASLVRAQRLVAGRINVRRRHQEGTARTLTQ